MFSRLVWPTNSSSVPSTTRKPKPKPALGLPWDGITTGQLTLPGQMSRVSSGELKIPETTLRRDILLKEITTLLNDLLRDLYHVSSGDFAGKLDSISKTIIEVLSLMNDNSFLAEDQESCTQSVQENYPEDEDSLMFYMELDDLNIDSSNTHELRISAVQEEKQPSQKKSQSESIINFFKSMRQKGYSSEEINKNILNLYQSAKEKLMAKHAFFDCTNMPFEAKDMFEEWRREALPRSRSWVDL